MKFATAIIVQASLSIPNLNRTRRLFDNCRPSKTLFVVALSLAVQLWIIHISKIVKPANYTVTQTSSELDSSFSAYLTIALDAPFFLKIEMHD